VVPLTGLVRTKAWTAVLISVVIILALAALPGLIGSQLGGLRTSPYF
jgi:purine-cytosine permease-like protein